MPTVSHYYSYLLNLSFLGCFACFAKQKVGARETNLLSAYVSDATIEPPFDHVVSSLNAEIA